MATSIPPVLSRYFTPAASLNCMMAKAVGDGTVYGQDANFTTAPTAPTVLTDPNVTDINWGNATITGHLNDLGTANSATVSFEWGLTSSYGKDTTPQLLTAPGDFNFALTSNLGLNPDTQYHFRAKAQGDITSYGADQTFSTTSPPWDVNHDRRVNVTDMVAIGLHWNERGTPGWIPEDVNKDGTVNYLDQVVIGLHWNQSW